MMNFCFAFTIVLLACLSVSANHDLPMTESQFLSEYLSDLKMMNLKDIPPEGSNGHGSPIEVNCSLYVINVFEVDSSSMEYTAEFYFRQSWTDRRLSYEDKDMDEPVLNDPSLIWTPDLFFVQDKRAMHHSITVPNTLIRISQLGKVLYSVRLSVTFSCPMDLRKFPHDVQKCTFHAESYGRTTKTILLNWLPYTDPKMKPLGFSKNVTLHNFHLTDVTEGTLKETFNDNTYSILTVTFTFLRKSGLYMTKLYIPFILLSIVSWTSLWIPSKMVALRLPLLLVILYLMVSINTDQSSLMPPTPYLKASDIWVCACEFLVFATLLQYVATCVMQRNMEKRILRHEFENINVNAVLKAETGINLATNSAGNIVASRLNNNVLSDKIDKVCRIVFPILFVAFNLVYWLMYCTGN